MNASTLDWRFMLRLALFTLLPALGGCLSSDATQGGYPCAQDQTCPAPLQCQYGYCQKGCGADQDCPVGEVCTQEGNCAFACADGTACPDGQVCTRSGACRDGAACATDKECDPNHTCCAGKCVDATAFQADAKNCGACGHVCTAENDTPQCVAGACSASKCASGFGDCDHDAQNGCETNLETSLDHCGACGTSCPSPPNATPACAKGACSASCDSGYADCNQKADDGCEVDITSDLENCNACGAVCPQVANGSPACSVGECVIDSCDPGFMDCDRDPGDGCEVHTDADPANCGRCGTVCPDLPNATAGCAGGACGIGVCAVGYEDCDHDPANGCEVNTPADVANCGACGAACPVYANGVAGCVMGACAMVGCLNGFADCAQTMMACVNETNMDPNNCGGCGQTCATPPNATRGCMGGVCGIGTCSPGFDDCDGAAQDGCEARLAGDANNCGACKNVCAGMPNAAPACANGQCGLGACTQGFADCDKKPANGCEIDVASDVANCGGCGAKCPLGDKCAGGHCGCTAGFAAKVDYPVGPHPFFLAAADLDGDGRLDLVAANMDSDSVSVLLGKGDGTFAAKMDYTVGRGPSAVAIGDLDGDGKPDIAVPNNGQGSTATILFNDGKGAFGGRVDVTTAGVPLGIAIGDLNGDQTADLVVTDKNDAVSIFLNNGNRTFAPKVDLAAADYPWDVTLADLDGDGRRDIVLGNDGDAATLGVFLDDGKGGFAPRLDLPVPTTMGTVTVADLDGDGKPDIVSGNESTLSVFLNQGNGNFAPRVDYPTGWNAYSVIAADFDGDGWLDLASVTAVNQDGKAGSTVNLLSNQGDGTFSAATTYTTGRYPTSLAGGDFNGDGWTDLAVSDGDDDSVSVLLNRCP